MKCLRFRLYTPTGIFKNPLSMKGIETYPLPPYSTIIGLIYRAMGRKWKGERFQISIQGDYEAMYRDYVWFKKYNFDKKKLERLPLQVPILYDLKLTIHVKAEEELLKEMEEALKAPKELLFLSGGEYPVKVEEVKIVQCEERRVSEENAIELERNVYAPRETLENVSFDKKGVLFSLSYFYENCEKNFEKDLGENPEEKLKKPRVHSWIDVYYFPKGTQVYGSLVFDDDDYLVFLTPLTEPTHSVKKELKASEENRENHVKFYAGNWLMASACVGVLNVLQEQGENVKSLVKEKTLQIPIELWEKLPEIYADYLLKDKEVLKNSYEKKLLRSKEKGDKIIKFNPYNVLVSAKLEGFHHDSPFTNPSSGYVRKLSKNVRELEEDFIEKNVNEILKEVKESFWEAYQKFLSITKAKNTSSTCFFCHEREAKNFVSATTFTPLFASFDASRNFLWNPIPICKECEFLLYFTSVGFYESGGRYLFVYVPDDLLKTYRLNQILRAKKEVEREKLGTLWDVVKHVIELEKQKSSWILENVYLVEVEKAGRTTANIYSFHVSPNLAEAIRQLIDKYPQNLKSVFFDFLFYVYTKKSLYEFLFLLLLGFFKKDNFKNLGKKSIEERIIQVGTKIKRLSSSLLFFINFQEVLNVNEKKSYVNWAFEAGRELKTLYEKNSNTSTQKKLEPLTYRLLEAIRKKDKEYFVYNLIRAYLEVGKEIPYVFKEVLDDESFNVIAYAFLIGLNAEKRKAREKLKEESREEEETREEERSKENDE